MTIEFRVYVCNQGHLHGLMRDIKDNNIQAPVRVQSKIPHLLPLSKTECTLFFGGTFYTLNTNYIEVKEDGMNSKKIKFPSLELDKGNPDYGFKENLPNTNDYEEEAYLEKGSETKGEIKIKHTAGLISNPNKHQYPVYFGNEYSLNLIEKSSNVAVEN